MRPLRGVTDWWVCGTSAVEFPGETCMLGIPLLVPPLWYHTGVRFMQWFLLTCGERLSFIR